MHVCVCLFVCLFELSVHQICFTNTSPTLAVGCRDGTREGQPIPGVAACAGTYTGLVHQSSAQAICDDGWHVCRGFGSTDMSSYISVITYAQATSFSGCYVYDSANDCDKCHTSCSLGYTDPGTCLTSDVSFICFFFCFFFFFLGLCVCFACFAILFVLLFSLFVHFLLLLVGWNGLSSDFIKIKSHHLNSHPIQTLQRWVATAHQCRRRHVHAQRRVASTAATAAVNRVVFLVSCAAGRDTQEEKVVWPVLSTMCGYYQESLCKKKGPGVENI